MAAFNYTALAQDLSVLVGRKVTAGEAMAVKRDLERHQTLAERVCSEDMSQETYRHAKAREAGIESRLTAFFGVRLSEFSSDPRGATVKFTFQSGRELTYFGRDRGGSLVFTGYRRR